MGRLQPDFLERVEGFADRILNVVDSLAEQKRSLRILDQLTGSGTAVGANVFEADDAPRDLPNQRQAMSNALSEGDMPPKMLAELRELGLF